MPWLNLKGGANGSVVIGTRAIEVSERAGNPPRAAECDQRLLETGVEVTPN
jgi:hypothetical protein